MLWQNVNWATSYNVVSVKETRLSRKQVITGFINAQYIQHCLVSQSVVLHLVVYMQRLYILIKTGHTTFCLVYNWFQKSMWSTWLEVWISPGLSLITLAT